MMTLSVSPDILEDRYYQSLERRLIWISAILGITTILIAGCRGYWRFAASFVVGAVVSYLNFVWLKRAVDRLIAEFGDLGAIASADGLKAVMGSHDKKSKRSPSRAILIRYFLRYALIGGSLYAIVRLRLFDPKGAVVGLLLFVAAVLFECIHLVVRTLLEERYGRT